MDDSPPPGPTPSFVNVIEDSTFTAAIIACKKKIQTKISIRQINYIIEKISNLFVHALEIGRTVNFPGLFYNKGILFVLIMYLMYLITDTQNVMILVTTGMTQWIHIYNP
jgi:hypothetical protein